MFREDGLGTVTRIFVIDDIRQFRECIPVATSRNRFDANRGA